MQMQSAEPIWDCVVVGAGIAGLAARHSLLSAGLRVLLLEKSRGLGGRMATRRNPQFLADLGAQFVSVRGSEWGQILDLKSPDVKQVWLGHDRVHPRYVHSDGMSQFTRTLRSESLESPILRSHRVTRLSSDQSANSPHWLIECEQNQTFHSRSVLLTAPLPQSLELLERSQGAPLLKIDQELWDLAYNPCLAAGFLLNGPSGLCEPGILKNVSKEIEGIFDQKLKGLRSSSACVVVHARAHWSREHWDLPEVQLLEKVWSLAREWLPAWRNHSQPEGSFLHRWRYCEPVKCLEKSYFFDGSITPLLIAGDSFGHSRVEGAYDSGIAAARALKSHWQDGKS